MLQCAQARGLDALHRIGTDTGGMKGTSGYGPVVPDQELRQGTSVRMTCSLIIRCYNEERHLPRLLEAVERQSVQPLEVIVVDSGSTDSTVRIAKEYGARVLHIARHDFSFGRSLNLGAETARGEYLVLASAHVYPLNQRWIEGLLAPFTNQSVAMVYGGQRGVERSKFSEHQIFKQWFPPLSSPDQAHAFCNNANAAIKRSVWTTLRYDENLPGLEDIHWAKRALERDLKIVYQADAIVAHVHEESYLQIFRRYQREAIGLRAIFPWEAMTRRQALSLYVSSVRADLAQAHRSGKFRQVFRSVMAFRAAQYWGAYCGLNWHGSMTEDVRSRLYYPSVSAFGSTDTIPAAERIVRRDAF